MEKSFRLFVNSMQLHFRISIGSFAWIFGFSSVTDVGKIVDSTFTDALELTLALGPLDISQSACELSNRDIFYG